MVTFVATNKIDKADDTDSEIEYINNNPLNVQSSLTFMVKYNEDSWKPLHSNWLDSSENEICGNKLDNLEEGKEKE